MKVKSQVAGHEPQVILKSAGHNLREPLVVQFNQWKGRNRISIRFHYFEETSVLSPGRRGVEFAVPMLDDVIAALQHIKEETTAGRGSEEEEIPF